MAKLRVFAKREIAHHHLMAHPVDGVMRPHPQGSYWEDDTWTYRRLRDGDITTNEAEAWRAPEKSSVPIHDVPEPPKSKARESA